MTTLTASGRGRSPFLAAARRLVAGILGRMSSALSRQAMNRRVLCQLSSMSERELKDIGLVRQDVVDAATVSGEQDASLFLIERRTERLGGR